MIQAIIKLQACTTKRGRYAFVSKGYNSHGIAKGRVRRYAVTGPSWAAIRRAVAAYDTATGRTMEYTAINAQTVLEWREVPIPVDFSVQESETGTGGEEVRIPELGA
jgi:hypothetical protein